MIFNDAMPLMAAHMVVAAYVVGGFLVASVYAFAMLRGRRDRYHRVGFMIAFSVAAVAMPIQMGVGDSLARWVYNNQPEKFAAIELVPETASDVPETLLRAAQRRRHHHRRHPDPRAGVDPVGSEPTARAPWSQGLDTVPADEQPTLSEVNTVHLAWDMMVGLGTLLFLLSVWYWAVLGRSGGDMPQEQGGSCASPPSPGVAAVVTMEAGWVVSEVGRQPWIVYNLMKVEDAATANTGVWVTFIARRRAVPRAGVTTILDPAQDEPAVPRRATSATTTCPTVRAARRRRRAAARAR